MSKALGERIRKFRQLRGIKQSDIARHLQMTESGYGKIERGETDPTISRLTEISKYLRASLADLLDATNYYDFKNGKHSPVALAWHNSSLTVHKPDDKNDASKVIQLLPNLLEKQTLLMDKMLELMSSQQQAR